MKSVCPPVFLALSLTCLTLSVGVKKGDRVSIYMPMVVELVVAMLACVRIGAVHSIVVSKKCESYKRVRRGHRHAQD